MFAKSMFITWVAFLLCVSGWAGFIPADPKRAGIAAIILFIVAVIGTVGNYTIEDSK